MIAEQSARQRFDVISKMMEATADLKAQIKALAAQLEAERARADKAERQVQVLEQQLTHPKKEIKTLIQPLSELRPEDIARADRDLADLRNQGWDVLDITVTVAVIGMDSFHDRIITLERAVPIPAEPIQPAAAVAAPVVVESQLTDAPAVPGPAPEPNPDALPVTRKTVSASAILEAGEAPAPVAPVAASPEPSDRSAEVKAAAQKTYEAALERNKMPAYKPIPSYKPIQGSAP